MMRAFLMWYDKSLTKRPLLTKGVSAFVIQSVADTLAQCIEYSYLSNKKRVLIQGVYGAVYNTPAVHWWQIFLARSFPLPGIPSVLKKIGVESLFFSPFIISSYFFIISACNEGSFLKGADAVQDNLTPTIYSSLKVWPFVHFINFWLVPLRYQLLVVNFVLVFWMSFLSYKRSIKAQLNNL